MDQLFVFMYEQTTCFHFIILQTKYMFLTIKFIERYTVPLNETTALPVIKSGV